MATEMKFSEDELAQVHLLVAQELESSRVELRHTLEPSYQDYIKQRIEQLRTMLKKMDDAYPKLRTMTPD